jgi:peptidoglycan-associated lipoprotein
MIRMTRAVPVTVLVSAALLASACRRTPETVPTTTTTTTVSVNTDSIARENARRDSIAAAERRTAMERARRDSIARANEAATRAAAELRNSMVATIHFNFDQSEILDQDRAVLDRKAAIMQANPSLRVRIAGHADERGSDTYNMALGQRRAASAKRYLESRGVAGNRIEIVSYGEERPRCESHEESCWAQNRRGEFEITAGGDNLMAPR